MRPAQRLGGEPGLADTTGPDEGDQPRTAEEPGLQALHICLPTDVLTGGYGGDRAGRRYNGHNQRNLA
ncbi:hypothetical protein GCM10027089_14020 [Nocardia thraciensis]